MIQNNESKWTWNPSEHGGETNTMSCTMITKTILSMCFFVLFINNLWFIMFMDHWVCLFPWFLAKHFLFSLIFLIILVYLVYSVSLYHCFHGFVPDKKWQYFMLVPLYSLFIVVISMLSFQSDNIVINDFMLEGFWRISFVIMDILFSCSMN